MLEWDILVSMFDALDMESYRVKPEVADRIEVDCNFSVVCESREVNIEKQVILSDLLDRLFGLGYYLHEDPGVPTPGAYLRGIALGRPFG